MSDSSQAPFALKMRELALSGHERGDDLLALADELDAAAEDASTPGRDLVKVWARCHRLWEECTGEKAFEGMAERAAKLAAILVLQRNNGRKT